MQANCPADAQMAVVQVVDSCAHCSPTQVNLHYLTFSRFIANPSLGNVSVVWQQVMYDCCPIRAVALSVLQEAPDAMNINVHVGTHSPAFLSGGTMMTACKTYCTMSNDSLLSSCAGGVPAAGPRRGQGGGLPRLGRRLPVAGAGVCRRLRPHHQRRAPLVPHGMRFSIRSVT